MTRLWLSVIMTVALLCITHGHAGSSPPPSPLTRAHKFSNWAGNINFDFANYYEPRTVEEVQQIVRAAKNVRVVGTRMAANAQLETSDTVISLRHLASALSCCDRGIGRFEGGITFEDLSQTVSAMGASLPSLAAIPELTFVGTALTGGHGSNLAAPIFASFIESLTLVTAEGDLLTLTKGDPRMSIAAISFGTLGVIVEFALRLGTAYSLRQCVYKNVPLAHTAMSSPQSPAQLAFDSLFQQGTSVSAFTLFKGPDATPPPAIRTGETHSGSVSPRTVATRGGALVFSSIWVKKPADALGCKPGIIVCNTFLHNVANIPYIHIESSRTIIVLIHDCYEVILLITSSIILLSLVGSFILSIL